MGNEGSQPLKYGERLDNDITVTWRVINCENPFPPRESHCSSAINNKLFIFGGVKPADDGEPVESNDLLVFDFDSNSWTAATCNGDSPTPRAAATMAATGNKLYVFGGLSRETGWFDDIHMYDTETSTWKLLDPQGLGPSARDKVSSAVIGDKIYVFGGFGPQGTEEEEFEEDEDDEVPNDQDAAQFGWFNDLYIYDTVHNTWSSPMQMNVCPVTPRAAHGMCSFDKYLAIFGGRDCDGRTNDLHIFDTETKKWLTNIKPTGCQPAPRSFHTCTAVNSRIIVTGGRGPSDQHYQDFHVFDTATRQWLQPAIQGTQPEGRGVHTVTVVGDQLVMFGGSSDFRDMQCHKFYGDIHTISIEDLLKPAQSEDIDKGETSLPGADNATCEPDSTSNEPSRNISLEHPANTDPIKSATPDDNEAKPAKRPKTDDL